jgi:hypothetical protein
MLSRAVVVMCLASGCFAELGAGYFPVVHQTPAAGDTVRGGAWMGMIKVGFFADVVLEHSVGFALGYSPVGVNVLRPKPPLLRHAGGGHLFRGDLVLPSPLFGNPDNRARIVAEYEILTSIGIEEKGQEDLVDHDGSGRRYFLGAGVSRTKEYGSQLVQIGLDHLFLQTDSTLDTSAWGVSGSITISVLPASHPNGITVYGSPTPGTSPGAETCGPPVCDADGNCTKTCTK